MTTNETTMIPADAIADMLSMSRTHIDKLVAGGELPTEQVGGTLYVSQSCFENFLETLTRDTLELWAHMANHEQIRQATIDELIEEVA